MAAFAKLIDENQVSRVTLAFEKAIADSFTKHPQNHLTRAEVKRRFDMCSKIFETLRSDLKWGVERILSKLPTYLDHELNGTDWTPDTRTIWAPGDGV